MWAGEPLPEDRGEDWADAWREPLIELYRSVLAALVAEKTAAGDAPGATDAARRLLATDPLDESSHRILMTVYARSGRRGAALRQYLECRRTLVDALGIEPGPDSSALQRRILAGEPV
jgi:DNA-binding SARP family transcriptional activator